jgi:MYXO-CTERM domain-containing protein
MLHRMLHLAVFFGVLAPTAQASTTLSGTTYELNYGDCGTWHRPDIGEGFQIYDPLASSPSVGWNDLLDSSATFSQITVEFDHGATAYSYEQNDADGVCDWTVLLEYTDSSAVVYHVITAGPLNIIKYETVRLTWTLRAGTTPVDYGIDHLVWYEVSNPSSVDIQNFQLMVGANSDPDSKRGSLKTINDVENFDTTDAYPDWAGSIGDTELTMGFAPCEPSQDAIGFASNETDPDGTFTDPNIADADASMHYIYEATTIPAGEAVSFGFIVGLGTADDYTRYYGVNGAAGNMSFDYCACDEDGDGWTAQLGCGGSDCDDTDGSINPGATEVWYDGVDQDCSGTSDYDADGDDHDASGHGGDDCDDTSADAHPGSVEVWYDGIDGDCDGADDYDADGDSYTSDAWGGDDCLDEDPTAHPGASDVPYDGRDADCSGGDYDADGDGHDSAAHGGDDCDDTDASVNPDAAETPYDGVDSDCDDTNEYDSDGDGHGASEHGGDDCDDTDASVNPEATETWYDGVDADCAGDSDYDADHDGHDSEDHDGEDCDDADDSVYPGAPEEEADGIDQDCTGADAGVDSDGDGLDDEDELDFGTDIDREDTDGDGLSDGEEVHGTGTDPTEADTDGGGVDDGDEVEDGTNPLDPDDDKVEGDDEEDDDDKGDDMGSDGDFGGGKGCQGCASTEADPRGLAALIAGALALGLRRRQAR